MKKFILSIIFFFSLFLCSHNIKVFAESNFTTDYKVNYTVQENSTTKVDFNITLINKTTQYYASQYGVQVGFENIENVYAQDGMGKIIPEVTKNKDGNSIKIKFNEQVVGIDKKLNFSISFDTKEIARKTGKIWDINIPGLTDQKTYNSFDVKVIVPKGLDTPSYIKPDTGSVNGNILTFTKEELGESGISISFGKEQIYDFDLYYHLKNSNMFPIKTEIALPPTTNYQDVQINSIEPKPENVILDEDGNWLAQYVLSPGKKVDIEVQGKAKVMLSPKKEPMSDKQLKKYTKEQDYWQISNAEIKKLASELKTPYQIYKYIIDNLTYDYSRVQENKSRIGAVGVLDNPKSAVCLEFTDLFIAIARAAGIPAREMNGFAFTQNSKERPLSLMKDILHAWPEYYDYDLQTWVMIDPTWANTTGGVDYFYKLDFDHFTFAIKGVDSDYPIPAGGYKISKDQDSKDINVKLADDFIIESQTLSISTDFADVYFSGFNPDGNIFARNTSSTISSSQILTINTEFLQPKTKKTYIDKIPPYGYVKIPIKFNKPSLLTNTRDVIKISINENTVSKKIKISLFVLNKWTILGGLTIAIFAITIFIVIYKTRHLSVPKQTESDPLRGEGQKSQK